ncbi:hypothetical protein HMPREF9182_0390 [Streptococcus sp. oral taxon 056 str. F0418]|nr:hypothetical protein HMPREF9182_0390 [Streptococcus sp. oral taxon 056 str. F0418]
MKLTYEDKVQIYELRKQGYCSNQLSNKFGINISNLSYMRNRNHKKEKNRYYSPKLKQEIINKASIEGRS